MEKERRRAATVGTRGHPTDLLPDYVRGTGPDPEAVRTHLTSCGRCREEVALLRALAMSGADLRSDEREPQSSRMEMTRPAQERSEAGWLSGAWKVSAAVALLIMGLGVWQVNREAASGGAWNPTAPLRGWEEDLETLRPAAEDVRLAFGYGIERTGVPWDRSDAGDPATLEAPRKERTDQRSTDTPAALVERFGPRMAEALGLDRSRRERLVAELQRSRRERAALAQRRREVREELAGLVQAGASDEARVESLFREIHDLRVQLARIDVDEDRRLAAFLTPLERARLFPLKQRLAERALDAGRGGGTDRRP